MTNTLPPIGPTVEPRIEYDRGLVERTVRHATYGDPKLDTAFHRETDRFYDFPDARVRDASFVKAFGEFFKRLGFDAALRRLLVEQPLIGSSVGSCIVGPALLAKQESAELLIRGHAGEITRADRTLMLQVQPQTLTDRDALARRMRPELVHIADMVDPAFRYRRSQIEGLPARRNLIRDRYRVLWDLYIMGRLTRAGSGEGASRSRLQAQFTQILGMETGDGAEQAFARIFDAPSLTHDQLFAWANAPEKLRGPGCGTVTADKTSPGANCPLCGFSTFDWYVFDKTQAQLVRTIAQRHPIWVPANGACRQCAEIHAFA